MMTSVTLVVKMVAIWGLYMRLWYIREVIQQRNDIQVSHVNVYKKTHTPDRNLLDLKKLLNEKHGKRGIRAAFERHRQSKVNPAGLLNASTPRKRKTKKENQFSDDDTSGSFVYTAVDGSNSKDELIRKKSTTSARPAVRKRGSVDKQTSDKRHQNSRPNNQGFAKRILHVFESKEKHTDTDDAITAPVHENKKPSVPKQVSADLMEDSRKLPRAPKGFMQDELDRQEKFLEEDMSD